MPFKITFEGELPEDPKQLKKSDPEAFKAKMEELLRQTLPELLSFEPLPDSEEEEIDSPYTEVDDDEVPPA